MKELTELPKKWCVKITEENREDLHNWRTDKTENRLKRQIGKYILSSLNGRKGYCVSDLLDCLEFTEITFEQFKKWVLKEETKSLVGRYLKALVDRPNKGAVKKGEIGIITDVYLGGTPKCVDFPSQKGYGISIETYNDGKSYELMPEGFKPEDSNTNKFEVGKWYRSQFNFYLKPIKIEGDCSLQGADYISDKGRYVFNGSGRDNLNNWELLTDLSEIQKYLPDGHVDKVVEEKWIPKVGDWAVCIVDYNKIWFKNRVWQIGKIEECYNNDLRCFPTQNGIILDQTLLFNSKGFRKAEPHEIPDSKESLLEEAKKRYPIGTKFKSAISNSIFTIKDNTKNLHQNVTSFCISLETNELNRDNEYIGCVYYNNKWAEIVSTPNPINPKTLDSIKPIGFSDSHSYSNSNSNKKLEIYIEPIKPREIKPIVELKIKTVSKLTI